MMTKRCLFILLIGLVAIACSKKSEKITDVSQLHDKRICILTGSAADLASKEIFPNAIFLDMVGSADAALAVKTGKADAFIYDKAILQKILDRNPELIILNEPISKLEVAAAIKKENTRLLSEMNAALKQLRVNGVLDNLRKKWVETNYDSSPPVPEINTAGANGTLKMGTCAIFEPYTFQSNGKFTGFDIELSQLLGELMNKKIEIVDMAFEGLIPALQAGKIDFALSNFTVTEERKKLIDYSEPYIANDICVLVRK